VQVVPDIQATNTNYPIGIGRQVVNESRATKDQPMQSFKPLPSATQDIVRNCYELPIAEQYFFKFVLSLTKIEIKEALQLGVSFFL
jgi:hypothetical protein